MEIILKGYVKGLGEKNDLVTVRDGYARNFLIPKGLAMVATPSNKKVVAENKRQASHKEAHIKTSAEKIANELANVNLVVETLAGADGKLFGSVTTLMIENKLKDMGYDVDRRRISFDGEIKEVGTFNATLDLHKEVKAKVKIEVVAKGS